jgi:cytochrome P460
MKLRPVLLIAVGVIPVALAASIAVSAQGRDVLKAPNGLAFADIKGYDTWADVAPSQTDDGIKSIVANGVMMNAYTQGVPANGKPFPDGSTIVKIEWTKKKNAVSPYNVLVPDTLKSVSFIEKDSKRFPDTNGWGYAQFTYDAAFDSFKPVGSGAGFGKTECHQCHTPVKTSDYIFTHYVKR